MIPEHFRRSPGAAATAVQNDVVGAGIQGELDIPFNVVGAELEAHRNATGNLTNVAGEALKVLH